MNIRSNLMKRLRLLMAVFVIGITCLLSSSAQSLSPSSLAGSWDCTNMAVSINGNPGLNLAIKEPRFMVYTFTVDGKWSLGSSNPKVPARAGTYELKGKKLVLKSDDGTKFQSWQATLSSDGNTLSTKDDKLFMTLTKLTPAP